MSRAWWRTPLIPALGRQRQADFWVRGQPGLQSEFQDSQGNTEKPCLEKPKQTNKQQQQPPPKQTKKDQGTPPSCLTYRWLVSLWPEVAVTNIPGLWHHVGSPGLRTHLDIEAFMARAGCPQELDEHGKGWGYRQECRASSGQPQYKT